MSSVIGGTIPPIKAFNSFKLSELSGRKYPIPKNMTPIAIVQLIMPHKKANFSTFGINLRIKRNITICMIIKIPMKR